MKYMTSISMSRRALQAFSLLLFCWLLSLDVMAQEQLYSGRVIDAETGDEMPLTTLYISPNNGVLTNMEGRFVLKAAPTDVVRISFVGYTTLQVKASDLPKVVKMQPLTSELGEVTVWSTDALLTQLQKKLKKELGKYERKRAPYFSRLTIQNGEQIEMVEAFLEASSAVHLRRLGVSSGRYWAKSPQGKVESALKYTNLHLMYSLGPLMRPDEQTDEFVVSPFSMGGETKAVHTNYEVTQTVMSGKGHQIIYCISLEPKEKKGGKAILGGKLYVDASSLQLLMFDGHIYNIGVVVGYGTNTERTDMDVHVHIDYQHQHGYTEVKNLSCTMLNEEVDCQFTLIDVEDYQLPLTFAEPIGRNLLTAIQTAGSNPDAENRFTFIERTDRERALIQDEAGTADAAGENEGIGGLDTGEALLPQIEEVRDTVGPLSYIKRAMRFNVACPQEKVYLHLDNTGYFKGETVWFKAYVTRTDEERRTDLSKVLYVELLNPSGDVVSRRKLYINNGEAFGDLYLSDFLTTGFYELRAFTRHMTNWGTQACYSRIIPVFKAPDTAGDYQQPTIDRVAYRDRLNNERLTSVDAGKTNIVSLSDVPSSSASASKSVGSKSFHVQFYPEGGNWVGGLPARIAFSALGKDGSPLEVQGRAVDAQGQTVTSFATTVEGRGVFDVPAGSKPVKVLLTNADGTEKTFDLPQPEPSGCTLMMNVMDDQSITADVHCSPSLVGSQLGYVVMHGGKVIRCDTLMATSHRCYAFRRATLPDGVSQFTLFNSEGRILAERLFFKAPEISAEDSLWVKSANDQVQPCGKVTFTIKSQPNSSVSFSAVDASGMTNGFYGNMRTWMLLGSEVRGYIAHPEYYLEADDAAHRRAADLLMLVQGWRRYDWNLMTGQSTFAKRQPVENGLLLYGEVREKKKKTLAEDVEITARLRDKRGEGFSASTPTEQGMYGFILPNIVGEWELRLSSTRNGTPANYQVCVDRHFSPESRFVSPQEAQRIPVDSTRWFRWDIEAEDTTQWQSITQKNLLLQNVTVKGKRKRVHNRWTDTGEAYAHSVIYYDCEAEADRIADDGDLMPGLVEWLHQKNSFVSSNETCADMLLAMPLTEGMATGDYSVVAFAPLQGNDSGEYSSYDVNPPSGVYRLFRDGPSYNNRPIVWVVDNQFRTITSMRIPPKGEMYIRDIDLRSNIYYEVPGMLDDVRSVYISDDTEAIRKHIDCEEILNQHPVLFYCYSYGPTAEKQKGVRNTHYQGFNMPSTFQMEDYSVVPPMEDFRRTIYWNPNVRLDRRGKATVEFYNNSSCTEMSVSAEGMTPAGKPLNAYQ